MTIMHCSVFSRQLPTKTIIRSASSWFSKINSCVGISCSSHVASTRSGRRGAECLPVTMMQWNKPTGWNLLNDFSSYQRRFNHPAERQTKTCCVGDVSSSNPNSAPNQCSSFMMDSLRHRLIKLPTRSKYSVQNKPDVNVASSPCSIKSSRVQHCMTATTSDSVKLHSIALQPRYSKTKQCITCQNGTKVFLGLNSL